MVTKAHPKSGHSSLTLAGEPEHDEIMTNRDSHQVVDPAQATAFLSAGRIVVVGASDDPKNFGRTIVEALVKQRKDVVAVHPHATTVAGAACYPMIAAVPGQVDGVIVMVPAERALDVVQECVDRKVSRVWLFQGLGHGAASAEAVQLCEESDIEVIPGACPLMFLEPVSGVHKLHRAIRRARGAVGKAAA